MVLAIVISLIASYMLGAFTMSLFAASAYEKGLKDGQKKYFKEIPITFAQPILNKKAPYDDIDD